jgi:1,2-phenylacetyl-CoA epoxidase catalytic subunit
MTAERDPAAIEAYLAAGGQLSAPQNAPPRYRAELMRLMATFVDSEMAGAAGFAEMINAAPGVEARIAAARIVAEKFAHAGRVLKVMADFGADAARYADQHPWAARLPREADIGATRRAGDMRLSVFHYPFAGWTDAVAMNLLMGGAGAIQLGEVAQISYQPLAAAFREILPAERRHVALAEAGLRRAIARDGAAAARDAVAYWRPRVAASFGAADSARFDTLRRFGLRREPNAALLARWRAETDARLAALGL